MARIYELPDAEACIYSLLDYLLEDYAAVRTRPMASFLIGMKQKVAIAGCTGPSC